MAKDVLCFFTPTINPENKCMYFAGRVRRYDMDYDLCQKRENTFLKSLTLDS